MRQAHVMKEFLERRTLGETRTEETRDLFDQSFGSQEGVVLFRELLDELFVLVEPEYIIMNSLPTIIGWASTHFFKSSTDMYSRSICLARSISAASARIQMDMRGRGTLGSLTKCDHRFSRRRRSTIR